MESKSYAFWTGLFIVTLAIILLLMVFWLSGDTKEYKPYILVSHSSVAGLNESAPVRLRGVQVGKVDGVQFDSKDPSAILIRVSVHKDAPITKGTYAQLSFQGLTGLSGVELSDDGKNPEPLETSPDDPARIEVKPSLMESVTNSGQIFIQRLNDLSARLLEVINEDSARHLQKTFVQLDQSTKTLATILKEAEPASEKLPVLARQLDEVLQEIKHTVKSVGVIAEHNNERLDRLEPKIAAVTENLNMASRSFAESTLPSVNQTLLSLQKTAESLDTLVQNLTERPQSILYGRPKLPPGPGEAGFQAP
jgi:phospholipid/cholesterol/gamma-HCH transport system substrate-binding protein